MRGVGRQVVKSTAWADDSCVRHNDACCVHCDVHSDASCRCGLVATSSSFYILNRLSFSLCENQSCFFSGGYWSNFDSTPLQLSIKERCKKDWKSNHGSIDNKDIFLKSVRTSTEILWSYMQSMQDRKNIFTAAILETDVNEDSEQIYIQSRCLNHWKQS